MSEGIRAGRVATDVVAVGAAALVALFIAGDAEATGRVTGETTFWSLLLAAAGCLALLWRRRWPVGVALVLVPMQVGTDFVAGAVLVAVYTVAVRRPLPVTLAVTGALTVASVPASVRQPDPELPFVAVQIIGLALTAGAVAVGLMVRARRESTAALRERAARAEAETDLRAERLRGQERERIAREMHDALAHRISLVSLQAGALAIRRDLTADEVAAAAGAIRDSAHRALEDLREILGVLRSVPSEEGLRVPPDLTGLAELVAESRAAGTDLTVDDRLGAAQPPQALGRAAYRVVQEGLTNVRKHAGAVPVRLELDRHDGGLRIRLSNPLGQPAAPGDAIPGARSGLIGLTERITVLGGRLGYGVRRGPDGELGFGLEAWLPWPV